MDYLNTIYIEWIYLGGSIAQYDEYLKPLDQSWSIPVITVNEFPAKRE